MKGCPMLSLDSRIQKNCYIRIGSVTRLATAAVSAIKNDRVHYSVVATPERSEGEKQWSVCAREREKKCQNDEKMATSLTASDRVVSRPGNDTTNAQMSPASKKTCSLFFSLFLLLLRSCFHSYFSRIGCVLSQAEFSVCFRQGKK